MQMMKVYLKKRLFETIIYSVIVITIQLGEIDQMNNFSFSYNWCITTFGMSMATWISYLCLSGIVSDAIGEEREENLRKSQKWILIKRNDIPKKYLTQDKFLFRLFQIEFWITFIILIGNSLLGVDYVLRYWVLAKITETQLQLRNLTVISNYVSYTAAVIWFIWLISYTIYKFSGDSNDFDAKKYAEEKATHYSSQHANSQFQWKLAPDDPNMPLEEKEERLNLVSARLGTSIRRAVELLEKRDFQPYEGMTEEFDGYYDRLRQLEERFHQLNLDYNAYGAGGGYWALPRWWYTCFQKDYQQFLHTSGFKRKRYLRKMKEDAVRLNTCIATSYDNCTKIHYFSKIQIEDSETALELLKEVNQTLQDTAMQTEDQKTLVWTQELDDDIKILSDCIQKRKKQIEEN